MRFPPLSVLSFTPLEKNRKWINGYQNSFFHFYAHSLEGKNVPLVSQVREAPDEQILYRKSVRVKKKPKNKKQVQYLQVLCVNMPSLPEKF